MKTLMPLAFAAVLWPFAGVPAAQPDLASGFADPPASARPRVFWWWLESHVGEAGITRDLEEMAQAGIGGALIFDAASGVEGTPAGPAFMGPEWRKAFRRAVREADRLGI
ncbi:MAG: hypothetical protein JXP34_21265 [Planctomycetes bacterium]|nr:hypothetical protein [Planctomycetota bacterium]